MPLLGHLRASYACAPDILASKSGLRCCETAGVDSKRDHGLELRQKKQGTIEDLHQLSSVHLARAT